VPLFSTMQSRIEPSVIDLPTKLSGKEFNGTEETVPENDNDRNGSDARKTLGHRHDHPESSEKQNINRCRREDAAATRSLHASSILVDHFQSHIRQITTMSINAAGGDASQLKIICKEDSNNNAAVENGRTSTSFDWSMQYYNQHSNDPLISNSIPTIIVLLPPNPQQQQQQRNPQHYSRIPSSSPLSPVALSLIHHENTYIRLTSLSAYISTLGGGFFLCRYLSTAISLARQQCCLAMLRGDVDMALKCRINMGYCYIHNGKLNRGKKVIRSVLKDVTELLRVERGSGLESESENEEELFLCHTPERELSENTIIRNMCLSALRFADQIRDAGLQSASGGGGSGDRGRSLLQSDTLGEMQNYPDGTTMDGGGVGKSISTTHDDFQRIRIVQDRKWN